MMSGAAELPLVSQSFKVPEAMIPSGITPCFAAHPLANCRNEELGAVGFPFVMQSWMLTPKADPLAPSSTTQCERPSFILNRQSPMSTHLTALLPEGATTTPAFPANL